jgi:predicted MPP superfamily phosphohydrolase
VVLALWAFWWEPSSLRVVHRTITIAPWHAEHSGLRVAVLSDFHVGSPFLKLNALQKIVTTTNAQNPDLVLLLGDFIRGGRGESVIPPEPIADALASLRAPAGVISVLGNHDWWYNGPRVRHALESRGIRVLDNEAIRVHYHGQTFWLCGLQDLWTRGDGVAATLAKVTDSEPVLMMMHNPDVFPRVPDRVSLTIAGHTHGGQVNLPVIGRPVVPSEFGQRYAYGLIEENGKKLFVTSGLGTSIIPVRFRVTPEIVILQLQAQ